MKCASMVFALLKILKCDKATVDNINISKYIFKYLSLGTYAKMHSRMATRNLKCMNKSNVLITQQQQATTVSKSFLLASLFLIMGNS